MESSDFKWFVVRTKSGKENKVKERLEREISDLGFAHLVEQIVVPMEKYIKMKEGKRLIKEKVYYSGYVFINAHINGELEEIIEKRIVDVVGFLREGKTGNPIPLRLSEVNRMLKDIDDRVSGEIPESLPDYMVNEKIKIIDGPFSSFLGIIEEIMEDKKKLRVNVKIFGRQTPVELNYLQVEKIDTNDLSDKNQDVDLSI
ncbi:MAG: transcription termination/antitermination protein NusG [Solitalea-like symbiont of Tyrophagus putrescentiae]